MASRLELQKIFDEIPNIKKVYFQPPLSVKLEYPCIVYKLDNIDSKYANNSMYFNMKRYQITIIDKNPDSNIPDNIMKLQMCNFDRAFSSDNLNHWVFNLYF